MASARPRPRSTSPTKRPPRAHGCCCGTSTRKAPRRSSLEKIRDTTVYKAAYVITSLTPDKESSVKKLAVELSKYSRLQKDINIPKKYIETVYINWINTCDTFIALDGDTICGYISIDADDDIVMLYVKPEYRGRGVARMLVNHTPSVKRVDTILSNTDAVNFYYSCGFKLYEIFNVYHYHAPNSLEKLNIHKPNF